MIQHEGPGWRLAWDSSKDNYSFLIGGENWAFELTQDEWNSLVPIIGDLIDQHKGLKNQLMPEETISIEAERYPWWACIDGNKHNWSLKLILLGKDSERRSMEAYWPIPSAQAITSEMRIMWDSN